MAILPDMDAAIEGFQRVLGIGGRHWNYIFGDCRPVLPSLSPREKSLGGQRHLLVTNPC